MTAASEAPDILSPEFAADPYSAYAVMREKFPLIWHEPMQSYIISRFEDVSRALKDPAFTTRNYDWQMEPIHGRTILQMDGREHSTHRALVAPAFRGNQLQEKILPLIERNARELIDNFRGTGSADLVDDFGTRFPINVTVDMLGLDKSDHDRFHRWYKSQEAFATNLAQDPDIAAAGLATQAEMKEYLLPLIARRRENLGDDLLSTLCEAEIDGTKMTDEEIKAFTSLLLNGGGETTDHALGSIFANLLSHPEQLAAVRADRSLIGAALAETLRYTPPVHLVMRQPSEDVEVSGGKIPEGSTVICLMGAANRDPAQFSRPDEFDIFRDDLDTTNAFSAAARHLSFALGRHFCVGALLTKAEVEVAVGQILDAAPDLRFADGFTPAERGVFTRGQPSVKVRFTPVS